MTQLDCRLEQESKNFELLEIQQQYDLIIEAIDRLQRYFQVESKIDLGQIDAYQQLQELLKGMPNAK